MTTLLHSIWRARKADLIFNGWPSVCRWQRSFQASSQAVSLRFLLSGALSSISPGWVLSFYFGCLFGARFHSPLGCRGLSRTTDVRPFSGDTGIPVSHNGHPSLVEMLMIAIRGRIRIGFRRYFVDGSALCFSENGSLSPSFCASLLSSHVARNDSNLTRSLTAV
jgi:hypothetical protein